MFRVALHVSVFCLLVMRGDAGPPGALPLASSTREPPQPHAAGCGGCRVTFMKCLVAGKDLPPDARKRYNERCSAAAGECYKGCSD
jgi:hypothetical protein